MTGLRGIAVFGVFLVHAGFSLTDTSFGHVFGSVAAVGVSGVTLFFVLSGYLLSLPSALRGGTLSFWRRRFARVVPVYFLALFIAVILLALQALHHGVGNPRLGVGNVLANIFLLQSWSPKGTDASIVVPAWCLSVEAFFYLVLPLGMVRFSRLCNRSPAAAFHLIVAACLLTAALITAKLCPATFPPAYLPVFAFGGYLATNQPKAVHVSTAAVLSVLGVIVYGLIIVLLPGTSFPAFTTTAVPFALLVHALAERDAQVARAPSRRVGVLSCDLAVRLGSWSYAFFLLHSLVIFVSDALVSTPPHGAAAGLTLLAVNLLVAIGVAAFAFRFLEEPCRHWLADQPGPWNVRKRGNG